jgi:hypothetical protein
VQVNLSEQGSSSFHWYAKPIFALIFILLFSLLPRVVIFFGAIFLESFQCRPTPSPRPIFCSFTCQANLPCKARSSRLTTMTVTAIEI